ncbi:MAG: phosphoribosylanthranilate isomerase, partial [Methanobrevibacter sp.]|nr:phosphoribosylanthranilate isomerase [Methanobrevibacter sp.]
MVKIKICGIKRLEDIEIVNRYKPDYIGFVFADSKRKVSHDLAKELRNNLDSDIIPVGVFVDSLQDEILKLFDEGIIEIAQLHGSESEQFILDLKKKTDDELKIINAIEMTQEID